MNELRKIEATLKTGEEKFIEGNTEANLSLLDFWKWSVSDLLSNATRGRFAEFIVGAAIGCDLKKVRDEWAEYDLISPEGIRIEVKSSAFIQSWDQKNFSKISFSIRNSNSWDPETGKYNTNKSRPSDAYVFCLLHHKDQATVNPLDLDQWSFYVVPTSLLNEKLPAASTISLNKLEKLVPAIKYSQIKSNLLA
jgi:hypothetical protein